MTRGRGRPVAVFDDTARERFLAEVAAGMKLGDAAQLVGVTPTLPSYHARKDKDFAQAFADAKARGKAARDAAKDHGEYRYNVLGGRCDICRAAATAARAARRPANDNAPSTNDPPTPAGSSPTAFSLRDFSSVPDRRAA
ncbi:hypothetical protein [Streptomyces gardneri]|uniref:hypothetical protein n=1 Tax=Streptomyces gardneri TaxID=66892 RepID=UPI0035D703DE